MNKFILFFLMSLCPIALIGQQVKSISLQNESTRCQLHFTEKTVFVEDQLKSMAPVGYTDSLFVFLKTGEYRQYYFIAHSGQYVSVPFFWDESLDYPLYENGVTLSADQEVISRDGKKLTQVPLVHRLADYFQDGVTTIFWKVSENSQMYKAVYLSGRLEVIYPNLIFDVTEQDQLMNPRQLKCGRRAYFDYGKKRWGFIDKEGRIIVDAQYLSVHDYSEGYAAVQVDSGAKEPLWGFIDVAGTMIIQPMFSREPSDFIGGYAIVRKVDGTSYHISPSGDFTDECYYLYPIMDGYYLCSTRYGTLLKQKEGGNAVRLLGLTPEYCTFIFDAEVPLIYESVGRTVYSADCHPLLRNVRHIGKGYFYTEQVPKGYRSAICKYDGECIIVFKEENTNRF